jgi:acyl-CoA synthetase (NDP forming)
VVVSNLAVDFHSAFEAAAREAGAPCLRGTAEGLFAVARFARWAAWLTSAAPPDPSAAAHGPVRARVFAEASRLWAARDTGRAPAEHEARALLEAYGVQGPREKLVQGGDEAVAAAREIGWPVVLKAMIAGIVHKTEAGLVRVGIGSDDEMRAEARAMLERAQAVGGRVLGLLVQEMARPIAELLVGGRVDPDFGPVIVVGGGGILVELYKDVAVRLAPVSEDTAREMIGETRAARLLAGWRGRPAGDVDAAAHAVARLSELLVDFQDEIAEVEINPLAVLDHGVAALDCLIAPLNNS